MILLASLEHRSLLAELLIQQGFKKNQHWVLFSRKIYIDAYSENIMYYCPEKSWYVLRVRSQAERLVHVGLHHKQFEVLNPTYQALSIRRDRRKVLTRPIFNGYMFIRTLLNPEYHLEILKTPGG